MNNANAENIELKKKYEKMTDDELIEILTESKNDFDNNVYELIEGENRGTQY